MRLVTRKIWRAFPELDRFDDAQCERFVLAANQRADLRMLRVLVVVAVLFLFGLSPLWATLAEELGRSFDLWNKRPIRDWLGYLWWHRPLLVFFGFHLSLWLAGVLAAGLTRDALLRRRVRKVMVSHGSCAACMYFLGGLPVGEDYKVMCPECGVPVRVHPSLVELSPGGAKFSPTPENVVASN